VRSEKHLSIKELKEVSVPAFLLDAKSKGYEVVGIEQTDRSGILGTEDDKSDVMDGNREDGGKFGSQDTGTLPKKCCLVLGSEKEGISAEVLAVIDRNVEIKTVGVTRSLSKF
jgi:tRNA guanosine-2'-O-methyltransferase